MQNFPIVGIIKGLYSILNNKQKPTKNQSPKETLSSFKKIVRDFFLILFLNLISSFLPVRVEVWRVSRSTSRMLTVGLKGLTISLAANGLQ